MRIIAIPVIATMLLGGCVASQSDAPQRDATAVEPPELEQLPNVYGDLDALWTTPCLEKNRGKPDEAEIQAAGIFPWLVDEVSSTRRLDFDIPFESVELADGRAFKEALSKVTERPSAEDEDASKLISWALGLTAPGVDVNAYLDNTEATLIAGFYDPDSKEVVVRSKSEERVSARTTVVLAHELGHAAADQALGFPNLGTTLGIDDRSLAVRAALEGDASLVEFRFLSRFTPKPLLKKAIAAQLELDQRLARHRASGMPELFIDDAVFPYQYGLNFTCNLYSAWRDWRLPNRAFKRPPVSTAQIMFPNRFEFFERPIEPRPLPRLESPWTSIAKSTIGAAHLKSLFEAPGNDPARALSKPVARVAAWGGGIYELWASRDDELGSLGMALVEHPDYPDVLCPSMRQWYEAAFPDSEASGVNDDTTAYSNDDQWAVFRCSGPDVRIGISPERSVAEDLAG